MTDNPLPTDYDPAEGFQDNGLEQCPHCERTLTGEGGLHGDVFARDGTHYDDIYDTDPAGGPYFCPECWQELDANRRAAENESIGDYA